MRAQLLAISLLGVLLASGCTTTTSGTASSSKSDHDEPGLTSTSESPVPDELPAHGAPRVENPLDTTRFQNDPCLSLTSAQSQDLDLGSGGAPHETAFGNGCKWKNAESGGSVVVIFPDENPVGLSGAYGAEEAGTVDVFIELPPIEGYPAVVRNAEDRRHLGTCTVLVGTSDEIAVNVVLQLSRVNVGKKDPCEVSVQVAGMAMQTIKKG